MEVARVLAKRSTCTRGQVGAVLVLERRIIATGYNGSPPGAAECTDVGCDIQEGAESAGCQRTIHAEANVIAFAARHGQATAGAVLYSTHGPCLKCAQLIAAAGVSKVVFERPYRLTGGLDLLDDLSIPAVQFTWDPEDPLPQIINLDILQEGTVLLPDGSELNLFQENTFAIRAGWDDGRKRILIWPRGFGHQPPSRDRVIQLVQARYGEPEAVYQL